MINPDQLKALGIQIQETGEGFSVISEKALPEITEAELKYLFGAATNFVVGEVLNETNYASAQNETKIINLEFERQISDDEVAAAAVVALKSEDGDEAPTVRLFNNLLSVAISRGASDIHINPNKDSLEVKMRFDGVLRTYSTLDLRLAKMLAARIKLLSGMDITERRIPQDGRFTVSHKGKNIDIRSASIPVQTGERIALRVFNQDTNVLHLDKTQLNGEHIRALRQVISKNHGLVLVSGPTGSGKTTTIYSMLNELRDSGQNIMTIEDPVEMDLEGIVQTQVEEDLGFTFATGLKSLMRNDPDVILVGEIRDADTAQIAVRAAMTGHLVISTVHANNPIGAVKRLLNLSVDATLLSDCLLGVFSQRLVRVYCEKCGLESAKSSAHRSPKYQEFKGCESCFHTGFSSRRPVMSHILIDQEAQGFIERNVSGLTYIDTISEEATQLYEKRFIPFSEVNKLKEL